MMAVCPAVVTVAAAAAAAALLGLCQRVPAAGLVLGRALVELQTAVAASCVLMACSLPSFKVDCCGLRNSRVRRRFNMSGKDGMSMRSYCCCCCCFQLQIVAGPWYVFCLNSSLYSCSLFRSAACAVCRQLQHTYYCHRHMPGTNAIPAASSSCCHDAQSSCCSWQHSSLRPISCFLCCCWQMGVEESDGAAVDGDGVDAGGGACAASG